MMFSGVGKCASCDSGAVEGVPVILSGVVKGVFCDF